jgi:hypothetical protein
MIFLRKEDSSRSPAERLVEMLLERQQDMFSSPAERRVMRRFDMRLPAAVRLSSHPEEFLTETQNVSARGVFFYLDRALPEGTPVEVTMTFPPHITLTDAVRVRFIARVVRVESPLPSDRVGVAAVIEEYEFLRSSQTPDYLGEIRKSWKASN